MEGRCAMKMKWLNGITRGGTNFLSWIGVLGLVLMMFSITVNVVMRYVLHMPISGSTDIVMILMALIVPSGLAYAESQDEHIAVTFLFDRLSRHVQRVIRVFIYTITTCLLLLFAWETFESSIYSFKVMESSDVFEIPFYPFKFILGIGFLFWALEVLLKFSKLPDRSQKEDATCP